jgi:hypothetical protein
MAAPLPRTRLCEEDARGTASARNRLICAQQPTPKLQLLVTPIRRYVAMRGTTILEPAHSLR